MPLLPLLGLRPAAALLSLCHGAYARRALQHHPAGHQLVVFCRWPCEGHGRARVDCRRRRHDGLGALLASVQAAGRDRTIGAVDNAH